MADSPRLEPREREFKVKFEQYRLAAKLRQRTALMPAAIEAKELDRSPFPSTPQRTPQERTHLRRAFGYALAFGSAGLVATAAVPLAVAATSLAVVFVSFAGLVRNGLRFADDELSRGRRQDVAVSKREDKILRLQRAAANEVARELYCDLPTIELSLDRDSIVNLRLEVADRAEELWLARGWSGFSHDDAALDRIYRDIAEVASNVPLDLARASEPQSLQGPNQSLGLGLRQQADTGE